MYTSHIRCDYDSVQKEERIMVKGFLDIAMLLVIGSLIVLVIMNPQGFATDVSSVSSFTQGESTILTGSGYKKAA